MQLSSKLHHSMMTILLGGSSCIDDYEQQEQEHGTNIGVEYGRAIAAVMAPIVQQGSNLCATAMPRDRQHGTGGGGQGMGAPREALRTIMRDAPDEVRGSRVPAGQVLRGA